MCDVTGILPGIQSAASVYRANLEGRRVLFVTNDDEPPLEVAFRAGNFMHLCGVDYPVRTPAHFLDLACAHAVDAKCLTVKYRKYTAEKNRVLPALMHIDSKARMIVMNPVLPGRTKADCIAIGVDGTMGFVFDSGLYVPDTVLRLDREWSGHRNVIAALKTERNSVRYTQITKKPKGHRPDIARINNIVSSLDRYKGNGDISAIRTEFVELARSGAGRPDL